MRDVCKPTRRPSAVWSRSDLRRGFLNAGVVGALLTGLPSTVPGAMRQALPAASLPSPATTSGAVVFVPTRGMSDQSAPLQALLDSGAQVVDVGSSGVVSASVVVPERVTLMSSGATMKPPAGARFVVATGGDGATLLRLRVDARAEGQLMGGETSFLIRHSGVTVSGAEIHGNGFRYGILMTPTGRTMSSVVIRGSTVNGTSYGILNNGASTENLLIEKNTFSNIRRGDAVELNAGGDEKAVVRGNTITGVRADGAIFGGMGIGIAGAGNYGQAVNAMTADCVVAGNDIRDVEKEAIHLEVVKGCLVSGNRISHTGPSRTNIGIAAYGSVANTLRNNRITGADVGLFDGLGVRSGAYVKSSNRNMIVGNWVSRCGTGVRSSVAGSGTSVTITGNQVSACHAGVTHAGSTQVTIVGNTVLDAAEPFSVRLSSPDTAGLTADSDVVALTIAQNRVLRGGRPVRGGLVLAG